MPSRLLPLLLLLGVVMLLLLLLLLPWLFLQHLLRPA
jgi:hypothetical protein